MGLRIYTGEDDQSEEEETTPEENFLGQYIPLHYHCNMLQDKVRVGAFRDAIALRVEPGMHILELGGGTGILSYLAAKQGARVTCVERNPELVRCAKQLLKQNGMGDVVEVLNADARHFIPNEPVDVVVCEMLHVALLREKQLEVIEAFKSHYQNEVSQQLPKFLPEASILMVQPVEQSYDFAGYWAPVPLFQEPQQSIEGTAELGALTAYSTVFYDDHFSHQFHWRGELPIEQSGRLTGLRFVTQNAIAIDVSNQQSINWPNQCMVLPVEEPLQVVKGQSVRIEFRYSAGNSIETLTQSLQVSVVEQASSKTVQSRVAG